MPKMKKSKVLWWKIKTLWRKGISKMKKLFIVPLVLALFLLSSCATFDARFTNPTTGEVFEISDWGGILIRRAADFEASHEWTTIDADGNEIPHKINLKRSTDEDADAQARVIESLVNAIIASQIGVPAAPAVIP